MHQDFSSWSGVVVLQVSLNSSFCLIQLMKNAPSRVSVCSSVQKQDLNTETTWEMRKWTKTVNLWTLRVNNDLTVHKASDLSNPPLQVSHFHLKHLFLRDFKNRCYHFCSFFLPLLRFLYLADPATNDLIQLSGCDNTGFQYMHSSLCTGVKLLFGQLHNKL